MKVKIEYKLGNRRVSASQWQRGIKEQLTDMASDALVTEARRTVCPVHHQTPTSVTRERGGVRVQGCCDELTAAWMRRISR